MPYESDDQARQRKDYVRKIKLPRYALVLAIVVTVVILAAIFGG